MPKEWYQTGILIIHKNKNLGACDGNGKLVVPIEYEGIYPLTHGFILTLKNNKYGLKHVSNKLVDIPNIHSIITYDRITRKFLIDGKKYKFHKKSLLEI